MEIIIIITISLVLIIVLFYYEIPLEAFYSVLLPPVIGFNINPALIVHLLNSQGSKG